MRRSLRNILEIECEYVRYDKQNHNLYNTFSAVGPTVLFLCQLHSIETIIIMLVKEKSIYF